ncbi:MAG: TatD family hydrolase [Fibrobacter sp.]|nr:TatD family hydrolase [Fibrobacter sp.]
MLVDSHIHLARLPEPVALAQHLHARNIRWTAVACEPWEWTKLAQIWEECQQNGLTEGCNLAFGIHPMIASQVGDNEWRNLERFLLKYPAAQVGEAGLDKRFPGYEMGGIQESVFIQQAKMARELGRDLQIHCVGDYGRILTNLGTGSAANPRPLFHRFGGDIGIAKRALEMGVLFSLHADSFKKMATAEAIKIIPKDYLRIETDADESFMNLPALESASPEQWAKYLEQILLENQAKINSIQ